MGLGFGSGLLSKSGDFFNHIGIKVIHELEIYKFIINA